MLVTGNGERQAVKRTHCVTERCKSGLITFWMHVILFTEFGGRIEVGFIFPNAIPTVIYTCLHLSWAFCTVNVKKWAFLQCNSPYTKVKTQVRGMICSFHIAILECY